MSLNQCLIGCQSVECAPKTCCSTNELDSIVTGDAKAKQPKYKKSKNPNKSNSLLSLNVTSLTKFRKMTGSAPDIIKKSVSESHVEQFGSSDGDISENITPNTSPKQSSDNIEDNGRAVEAINETIPTSVPSKEIEENCNNNQVDGLIEHILLEEAYPKVLVTDGEANPEHAETSLKSKESE